MLIGDVTDPYVLCECLGKIRSEGVGSADRSALTEVRPCTANRGTLHGSILCTVEAGDAGRHS